MIKHTQVLKTKKLIKNDEMIKKADPDDFDQKTFRKRWYRTYRFERRYEQKNVLKLFTGAMSIPIIGKIFKPFKGW